MDEVKSMDIECAHCGNKQLVQLPGTWSPMPMNESGGVFHGGPAMPVVMFGCVKCGFVQMFSPSAVKAEPWPQPEGEQQAEEKDEQKTEA